MTSASIARPTPRETSTSIPQLRQMSAMPQIWYGRRSAPTSRAWTRTTIRRGSGVDIVWRPYGTVRLRGMSIRPAITLAELFGSRVVYVPRRSPSLHGWSPLDPGFVDFQTGHQLAVAGTVP